MCGKRRIFTIALATTLLLIPILGGCAEIGEKGKQTEGIAIDASSTITFPPGTAQVGLVQGYTCGNTSFAGPGFDAIVNEEVPGPLGIGLEFRTDFIPTAGQTYPFTPDDQLAAEAKWTDGTHSITLDSTGVEKPVQSIPSTGSGTQDAITAGSVTFTSLTQDVGATVALTFSVTYDNGKTVSGTAHAALMNEKTLCF